MRSLILFFVLFSSSANALDWYWIALKNHAALATKTESVDLSSAKTSFTYAGYGGRVIVGNSGCQTGAQQTDSYWESDFFIIPKRLEVKSNESGRSYYVNTNPLTYNYVFRADANSWVFGNPVQQHNLTITCLGVGSTSTATPGMSNVSASVLLDITTLPPGRYTVEYPGGVTFVQWGSHQNIENIVRIALGFMTDASLGGNFIKGDIIVPNYCTGTADDIYHGQLTPNNINGHLVQSKVNVSCLKQGSSVKLKIIGGRKPNDYRYKITDGVTSLGENVDSKITFSDSGFNESTVTILGAENIFLNSELLASGQVNPGRYEGSSIVQLNYD
ncbi:hypothetical protein S451_17040 [Salmonella enterica subsp. enterica]|nr:hypothetical protein [Salmonella enterica subsp. enterica]ECJ7251605.1 hypothetical protein [Salmonella enterica subsp. enterica]